MRHTEKRQIGQTGVAVSRLGYGGTALAGAAAPQSEGETNTVIAAALAAGITYFDTSPFYGHGLSEHRLGTGLRHISRDKITVSTKVGRLLAPDPASAAPGVLPFRTTFDYSRAGALRSFEDSLQRLGMDHIDLLIIHDLSHIWHADTFNDRFAEARDGALPALADLRSQGAIKAIGLGTNDLSSAVPMTRTGLLDCVMIAREFNLLNHAALLDQLAPVAAETETSLIVAAPFASGILATGLTEGATYMYHPPDADIQERVSAVKTIATTYDVPLRAAALQFAATHPLVASVATGLRSEAEIHEAVAAFNHSIPTEFWEHLCRSGLVDERAVSLEGRV